VEQGQGGGELSLPSMGLKKETLPAVQKKGVKPGGDNALEKMYSDRKAKINGQIQSLKSELKNDKRSLRQMENRLSKELEGREFAEGYPDIANIKLKDVEDLDKAMVNGYVRPMAGGRAAGSRPVEEIDITQI